MIQTCPQCRRLIDAVPPPPAPAHPVRPSTLAGPPSAPDRLRPDVVSSGAWCGATVTVEVMAIVIALGGLVAAAFALGFVVGAG